MDKANKVSEGAKTPRRTSRRPGCAAEGRAPVEQPPRRALTAWEVEMRPTPAQERVLDRYLNRLTGFWNWSISRYQWHLDNRTFSEYSLDYELKGHAKKCGLPRSVMIGMHAKIAACEAEAIARREQRGKEKAA